MELNITIVSIILVIVAIWVALETKRFKHRVMGIMIIILILMTYFSFTIALSGHKVDLSTLQGVKDAGATYFIWLGGIFGNLRTITTNAINMNWGFNANSTLNQTSVASVLNSSNVSG